MESGLVIPLELFEFLSAHQVLQSFLPIKPSPAATPPHAPKSRTNGVVFVSAQLGMIERPLVEVRRQTDRSSPILPASTYMDELELD